MALSRGTKETLTGLGKILGMYIVLVLAVSAVAIAYLAVTK